MKTASKLVVPLVIAAIVLGAAVLLLPLGAAARDDQPILTEKIEANTGLFGGESEDIQLSFQGGNLPRVAANDSFVALVYEQNNRVFIRSAQAPASSSLGWTNPRTLLDSTRGNAPRLAFSPVGTDTLHVVWTGYGGSPTEVPEKVIRHTKCTLAQSIILCSPPDEIESAAGAENLKQPDVAVDEDGRIHVAWFDESGGGVVKTALSQTVASDWSTSSVPIDGNTTNAGQVALATAGGFVHLAFRDFDSVGSPTAPWQVKYVRTAKTAHSWSPPVTFGEVLNYGEIRNPTIAASGSKVQIAWDTEKDSDGQLYGLMGASSADSGVTWPDADKRDIPSNAQVVLLNSEPISKASQASGSIPVNAALRPSLAVTGTNEFAIVWQQLPYKQCNPFFPLPAGPHPSQIYYASDDSGVNWAVNGRLSDNVSTYKVGPDLAVDSNGTHIVFMKVVDDGDCSGGNSTDYTIYYRGPYKDIQISRISYLPVIVKVN